MRFLNVPLFHPADIQIVLVAFLNTVVSSLLPPVTVISPLKNVSIWISQISSVNWIQGDVIPDVIQFL